MSNLWGVSSSSLAVVMATVLLAPTFAGAQARPAVAAKTAAKTKTWTPPRTPDGRPDLQGIWSNSTITPLERPRELAGKQVFTEQEAAAYEKQVIQRNNADLREGRDPEADVALAYNDSWYDRGTKVVPSRRTSLIVDPPDGRIPALTAEAQKRAVERAEARRGRGPADSWEDRSLGERCITRGAPKLPSAYNNNFEIVQTPGHVAILQEMIHEVRIIPLDGRPHVDKNVRQWLGDSRGHWEGNTLVVDTTNFDDRIVFNAFNCCGAAGANLHLVERFTRVDNDTIDYQYTVD